MSANNSNPKKAADVAKPPAPQDAGKQGSKKQKGSTDTVKQVVLDSLTVMKIVKHCSENFPNLVTGQLLGLPTRGKMEVTNCFPFPKEETAGYQVQMMTNLREVNIDSNAVGWYQTGYYGTFLTQSLIDGQAGYQSQIPNSILIIYDPLKANQGFNPLRAYCLNPEFLKFYKQGVFTFESLKECKLNSSNIFREIPISISTSTLAKALVHEMAVSSKSEQHNLLQVSNHHYLEKNLESLTESVDLLTSEQIKAHGYLRAHAKQQILQEQYHKKKEYELAMKKEEDAAREAAKEAERLAKGGKAKGKEVEEPKAEEPQVPEEDLSNHPAFKQLNQPSRLEGLLISNQIHNHCTEINHFAAHSFAKLFLTEKIINPVQANQ